MRYLAHRTDEQEQTLWDHLQGVAERAGEYADVFGAGDFARCVALHHDLGKYSSKFQERIRGSAVQVDHSSAGAQHLYQKNKNAFGLMAAYCIAGHHGGVPDGGSISQPQGGGLYGRLNKSVEPYEGFKVDFAEVNPALAPIPFIRTGFQASLFTRMIFSCLVDADWLDTERFMSGERPRGRFEKIEDLWKVFRQQLSKFENPQSELNRLRTEILENCLESGGEVSGLYTLTAPTGSGKTISSMAFALKHAAIHKKRRVIYVVPYNTIIEQNAEVFERMLGADSVIQHHSGISYSNDENAPDYQKLLATENWDAPVIVTSSVRFFESLYSNKPSSCRKLHNIAGSVIIFDEAQMIPLPYLIPCVEMIKELVVHYGCTAVLATATQSSLDPYFEPLRLTEIVHRPKVMYEAFRRVRFDRSPGKLTTEELAERLSQHEQVLCIVNTRRKAQNLAAILEDALHLSTTMYPQHRRQVLAEVRKRLMEGHPCLVISTSLIEAGVDVDFPVVYRERAGLDSIVQAAGRCNRENKRDLDESIVYIFESDDRQPVSIAQNTSAYEHIVREFADIASLDAIKLYFEQLRYILGPDALDKNEVIKSFNDWGRAFSLPFDTIARSFRLIEEQSRSVYVLLDEQVLAHRLRSGERSRQLFRDLQAFAVSLREWEFKELEHQLEYIDDEIRLLTFEDYYDARMGVELTAKGGKGLFI